jgi:hypothetical protein
LTSYNDDRQGASMFPSSFAGIIDFSRRPRDRRPTDAGGDAPVLIRRAAAADQPAIARLSALDERELPHGERLIAEVAGRPVAAVELCSGMTVADPFVPTRAIVELLGLRATQVRR